MYVPASFGVWKYSLPCEIGLSVIFCGKNCQCTCKCAKIPSLTVVKLKKVYQDSIYAA